MQYDSTEREDVFLKMVIVIFQSGRQVPVQFIFLPFLGMKLVVLILCSSVEMTYDVNIFSMGHQVSVQEVIKRA